MFKNVRRKRLMAQPLRPDWLTILEHNTRYYRGLPAALQRDLQGLVQIFLDEKKFEGCGGFELTDEVRVTIAAHACLLLLGRDTGFFAKLRSILVYPSGYVAPISQRNPDGTVAEGFEARLGESWSSGNVVLSWHDVRQAISGRHRGRNIILHEFAHQLDAESGSGKGAPWLPGDANYADWARVLGEEYDRLSRSAIEGTPTVIDKYGATSPAEFFAVATECFFEMPHELAVAHPELYGQLKLLYRLDPASMPS